MVQIFVQRTIQPNFDKAVSHQLSKAWKPLTSRLVGIEQADAAELTHDLSADIAWRLERERGCSLHYKIVIMTVSVPQQTSNGSLGLSPIEPLIEN